jgi:hypothetical protein
MGGHCSRENAETVCLLAPLGVDLNVRDEKGATLAYCAAQRACDPVVGTVVSLGVEVDARACDGRDDAVCISRQGADKKR